MENQENRIEELVGDLYAEFFKLRQNEQYQEEYDSMGVLVKMLQEDRQYIREQYNVKI